MTQFSEKTRLLLEEAGWTEGREIDPTPYVEALKKEGYTVFPPVIEFMRQFGGLRIPYRYKGGFDSVLHFDTTDITATILWNVNHYATVIGVPLCLIGEADDYFAPLMMDSLGRVYITVEGYIYLIGEAGEDGIESFLENDAAQLIQIWRNTDEQ